MTDRICFSIIVYSLWLIVYMAAGIIADWVGAYIVGITFGAWLIIRAEIQKKAGTFNGSLLLGDFLDK